MKTEYSWQFFLCSAVFDCYCLKLSLKSIFRFIEVDSLITLLTKSLVLQVHFVCPFNLQINCAIPTHGPVYTIFHILFIPKCSKTLSYSGGEPPNFCDKGTRYT